MICNPQILGPKTAEKVTLTPQYGYGDADNCYIEVNGAKYFDMLEASALELDVGTEVYCRALASRGGGGVFLNEQTVASAASGSFAEYTYIMHTNITINMDYDARAGGYIYITEN